MVCMDNETFPVLVIAPNTSDIYQIISFQFFFKFI